MLLMLQDEIQFFAKIKAENFSDIIININLILIVYYSLKIKQLQLRMRFINNKKLQSILYFGILENVGSVHRRMESEVKAKVVASLWGQNLFNSLPR